MTFEQERRRPVIMAMIGYPGMGKSTMANLIADAVGVPRLRLGRFLKDRGLLKTPEEMDSPELFYKRLLQHTDEYLKDGVRPCLEEHGWAVLDGFPRSIQEVEALVAFATEANAALTVLHFDIDNAEERIAFSFQRQRDRAVAMRRTINDAWYHGKVQLANGYELVCVDRLRELNVRLIMIDPRQSLPVVEEQVRAALRLDFARIPWDRAILEEVRRTLDDAFVSGAAFWQPFFNGNYGPLQDVRLVEVVSPYHELVSGPLQLHGRVRLDAQDRFQVELAPGVEAALRRGILQPNPKADPSDAERAARQLVRAYPGLSAPFIGHQRRSVLPDWSAIHAATLDMERGGRRQWQGLSPAEEVIAHEMQIFLSQVDTRPMAPPLKLLPSSSVHDPWRARDDQFCVWLLDQNLNPRESIRLKHALTEVSDIPQKPTHQGWMTDQHVFASLLQLQTDHLPEDFRFSVRLAMLYHDHGKRRDIHTPGAHAAIGARLWNERYAAQWSTELMPEEQRLIAFLIMHHDMLGRLARGAKEADYAGGIDPEQCRKLLRTSHLPPRLTLNLIEAINRADIASVAALRWTLPELDFARRMILTGLEA